MAGLVTFAVLGQVQELLQQDDIVNAVRGGPGYYDFYLVSINF